MVLTLYEGLIEHQIYPGLFNTAYYEGNNMFSLIKSRKVLFIQLFCCCRLLPSQRSP
ncbi:hypothetical protein SEEH0318_15726, partial [Salmonella enterica subsp. enterica serovar Heidelberg str. 90-0318]